MLMNRAPLSDSSGDGLPGGWIARMPPSANSKLSGLRSNVCVSVLPLGPSPGRDSVSMCSCSVVLISSVPVASIVIPYFCSPLKFVASVAAPHSCGTLERCCSCRA